jgi:hypothetical protein
MRTDRIRRVRNACVVKRILLLILISIAGLPAEPSQAAVAAIGDVVPPFVRYLFRHSNTRTGVSILFLGSMNISTHQQPKKRNEQNEYPHIHPEEAKRFGHY